MSDTGASSTSSWLLPGFLARPSLSFLLGTFGAKKTWLSLDLAISIAAGHPWLGFSTLQAPSIYIDYTYDLSFNERVLAVLSAHAFSKELPFRFGQDSFIHALQKLDSLLPDVLPYKPGLIVLDSPFGTRLDLNARKVHSLFPYLVVLHHLAKEANAAVLVLHDLRSHRTDLGSALIAMGADHVLAAESDYGKQPVHLRTLDSADGTQVAINAQVQSSRRSAHISLSLSVPPSQLGTLGKRLLRHLQQYGQATTAQLLSSFPYSTPKRISNLIQELLTDGYIYRCNSGGRGSLATYQITPAGYQAISHQVSTPCQVSTASAPASASVVTSSHLSGSLARACPERSEWVGLEKDVADKSTPRNGAHSKVYNRGFHNPFVSQRKPCSE